MKFPLTSLTELEIYYKVHFISSSPVIDISTTCKLLQRNVHKTAATFTSLNGLDETQLISHWLKNVSIFRMYKEAVKRERGQIVAVLSKPCISNWPFSMYKVILPMYNLWAVLL
jgi:hypothetical protein